MLKGTFKIQMSHLVPIKIKLFDGIKTIESAVHQESGGRKGLIPLMYAIVFILQISELSYNLSLT